MIKIATLKILFSIKYFLTLLFILAAAFTFAQDGKLKVYVKSNGEAIAGVGVSVTEIEKDGLTDGKGKFELKGLVSGAYTVKLTMIGFESQTRKISIVGGQTTTEEFSLIAETKLLQGVEITGRRERGYKSSSSFSATKTETNLRDVPQAVSYVTKELIDDQMAFNMMDVLKNISGVSQNSFTNNKYILRGFESESKQTLINGLKAFSGERNADILPYVEKLEVIKGPASALFANSSPGGTINTVTKKPLEESRKSINFTTGSFNTVRVASDFTGPMNQSRTLLYRLNLAYQNTGSFRTLQGKESFAVAPSFSFIPDDKTRINFDLVFVNDNGRNDRGQPSYSPVNGVGDVYATPTSLSLSRVNDAVKSQKLFSTLSLNRKITNAISFNLSYLKGVFKEDLREHRTANQNAVDENGVAIPDLLEMRYNYRLSDNYSDNLSSYFVFDFKTGPVDHKLLAGYDFIQNADGLGNTTSEAKGYLSADGKSSISKYDPTKKSKYLIVNGRPVPNVPFASLSNTDYSISDPNKYISVSAQDKLGKYKTNGVYVQEQLAWRNLKVLLSLRKEFYTDVVNYGKNTENEVKQSALLPRFGLVYTPIKMVSVYGTYVYGFQPQSASYIGDPTRYGGPFDPLKSNMIEVGVKSGWFDDKLSANLAFYKIEQNNVLQSAGDAGNPDLLRQIGQITGKGIELDIYGSILPNLNLTANLAINKTEITKSLNAAEIGKQAANSPKFQGGIWAKYDFITTDLKGLGVALGTNFQSDKTSEASNLTLPKYTLVNGALYYTINKIKLSGTFNNIFNKTYWLGADSYTRLFPGAPRSFLFGVGYTF